MKKQNIEITENAIEYIKNILKKEKKNIVVYIAIIYQFTKYAHVNITYCKKNDLNKDDIKLDKIKEIEIYIEKNSIKNLNNSKIDYINKKLKIRAPNINAKNNEKIKDRIKNLIENEINVMLSQHGGFLELIDVKNDKIKIKFHGGCQGCGMINFTLNNYIDKIIKKNFPEIKKIEDITSHEIKTNAYF